MSPLVPTQWESWVRPGSRVFVGGGSACPRALMRSLCAHAGRLRDIELLHGLMVGDCPWLDPKLSDTFSVNLLFTEAGGPDGHVDRTPCFASEVPGLFLEGILPLDVALVQVSPPDNHGYCSLGTGVDLAASACRAARAVIAQVNPSLPRTHGQGFVHVDAIHAFIEADEPLPEFAPPGHDVTTDPIGQYVAHLVPDRATLHVGFGSIIDTVLAGLGGHKDLGLHTEILTDGFLPLLRSGVINNRAKTIHAGKTLVASCIGTRALYDFARDNPHVEFHPTEYLNSPAVIARHDRMVSVNGGEFVDLSGQVSAESARPGLVGGVGSYADFFRGATMSRDGVPIIALRSVTRDGKHSRIIPTLHPGSGVVTSRGHVHYVVTEYGVATLRGRSIRERALELIQVAHPDFRDELLAQAVSAGWIPSYQRSSPRPVAGLGGIEVRKVDLKAEPFILRPLAPSDIRRLQEFFYSHSLETIRMRYGYAVTRMTRERAYDLVNVDQERDLALAVFEVQGPRQIIHAIGRYYLDNDGRGAEIALVVRESKRRHGMASLLMNALISVARKRGLDHIWGRVRRDNLPMLALFKRFGGQIVASEATAATEVDIRVALGEEPKAPERAARVRKGAPGGGKRRSS